MTFARRAGFAPEALLAAAEGACDDRVRRLGEFETAAGARRAWREAVRRSASGQPGAMPLACIEWKRRGMVLGLEGEEPRYSLRRVFSLQRFAEP